MHLLKYLSVSLSVLWTSNTANSNLSTPLTSQYILPSNFKPPEVFKNINLLRTINLEKGYINVSINLVIENTNDAPQTDYYLPFKTELVSKVGGLKVRDRKHTEKPLFRTEITQYDPYR